MSDKPLVQQGLASELAEIILSISSPSISLAFLDGFWQTHVREWSGIDRLRLVYYLLCGVLYFTVLQDRQVLHARPPIRQCRLQASYTTQLGRSLVRRVQ